MTTKTADWRVYPAAELTPILAASLTEFAEHGYDGTSVRSIAGRVGVTVPALYYHHENKQALLVALLDRAMELITSHSEAAAAEAGADPRNRLSAIVEAIVHYMVQCRDLAFLNSEMRSLTTENRARYVAQRDRVDQLLRDCIQAGINDGSFGVPWASDATRAILSMCQGIAGWYDPAGTETPQVIADRHVHLALAMVEAGDTRLTEGAKKA
ncbi:TetR/AcrR family transcriptional regulator [Flexivirga meconopsidis]|uniref:TetR/AcrR family transcriptional regulator n=1 Tax=Flexivirga meconopsidis TaxID=2977121 RepID=UPI00224030DD|nr:TetR/AcrR family transcriptional regulator [Flexivirga meconopsidis]